MHDNWCEKSMWLHYRISTFDVPTEKCFSMGASFSEKQLELSISKAVELQNDIQSYFDGWYAIRWIQLKW